MMYHKPQLCCVGGLPPSVLACQVPATVDQLPAWADGAPEYLLTIVQPAPQTPLHATKCLNNVNFTPEKLTAPSTCF